jgi:hypothetical protein
MTTVNDCRMLDLPRVALPEGNITPVEGCREIPYEIERIFYLYDVPGGAERGGHAHRTLQQTVVAVMGAFTVVLDDGHERRTVLLNRAYQGIYVPPLIWSELSSFSSGGICLALVSAHYDEADYVRDYSRFIEIKRGSASRDGEVSPG